LQRGGAGLSSKYKKKGVASRPTGGMQLGREKSVFFVEEKKKEKKRALRIVRGRKARYNGEGGRAAERQRNSILREETKK